MQLVDVEHPELFLFSNYVVSQNNIRQYFIRNLILKINPSFLISDYEAISQLISCGTMRLVIPLWICTNQNTVWGKAWFTTIN